MEHFHIKLQWDLCSLYILFGCVLYIDYKTSFFHEDFSTIIPTMFKLSQIHDVIRGNRAFTRSPQLKGKNKWVSRRRRPKITWITPENFILPVNIFIHRRRLLTMKTTTPMVPRFYMTSSNVLSFVLFWWRERRYYIGYRAFNIGLETEVNGCWGWRCCSQSFECDGQMNLSYKLHWEETGPSWDKVLFY